MGYYQEKRSSQRLDSVLRIIRMIHSEVTDPHVSKYIAEDCKYDLVMLKYEIEKMLRNSPNFGEIEEDWNKEITMKILKEK